MGASLLPNEGPKLGTLITARIALARKRNLHQPALREGPELANKLEWLGGNRWSLGFPYAAGNCRAQAGHCKCQALSGEPEKIRILIGDGRSDFCAAETADLVVAKSALAEHCQAAGLAYIVFGNFAGATTLIADWIGGLRRLDHMPRSSKGMVHASPA